MILLTSVYDTCGEFLALLLNFALNHSLLYLTPDLPVFKQAQSNITELNTIVWGTCNTNTSEDTCNSNMQWFTDNLKTQCAQDLQDQNAIVQATLIGKLSRPVHLWFSNGLPQLTYHASAMFPSDRSRSVQSPARHCLPG